MRLTQGFITHNVDDEQIMVASGDAIDVFHGIVQSNETAAYIIDSLKEETTQEKIVDDMCNIYDAPKDVIKKDVEEVIGQLREIGAIQE